MILLVISQFPFDSTAPAKTRIPEKTSPDATTSPVFGRSGLRRPPLFHHFEPGEFGVVVVPE